jgi:hypothetical protein
MRDPAEITKDELRELLGKGWLTHDGAWFLSVAGELGMEAANRFNKAAIKGMAPFETRRTMKVLEVEPEDLQDMKGIAGFVTAGLGLIMPDSVITRLLFDFPGENVMHWEWEPGECFAYKSMKQMGQIDAYECGVIYRIREIACFTVQPRFDCYGLAELDVPVGRRVIERPGASALVVRVTLLREPRPVTDHRV